MTIFRSDARGRARWAAAALAALSLAASAPGAAQEGAAVETGSVTAPAPQEPPRPRIEDLPRLETAAEAVVEAAAIGGAAGLTEALTSCWRSSAGYGVEALAPCALRERAAVELLSLLAPKIGPPEAETLGPAAAQRRIREAYAAREAAPTPPPGLEPLLRYDLARRIEPSWSGAPTLEQIGARIAAARRAAETGGEGALRAAAADCWMRLALDRESDGAERVDAAWACRLNDLLAGGPSPLAASPRALYFKRITTIDPTVDAALDAVMETLWPSAER